METFNAVFADSGVPTITITDLKRGVVLNRLYFRRDELSILVTKMTHRLTIKIRSRGFEAAPGAQWTINDIGGYSVDAVRRTPERYRVLLVCGCTVWADYPPMRGSWWCSDHLPDHQMIHSYLDTLTEHVIEVL